VFSQIVYKSSNRRRGGPGTIDQRGFLASIPILRENVPAGSALWPVVELAERLLALGLLVAFSPVLVTSAIALGVLSRRSPLIAHRRVGWRGATLRMLKLRTMWTDAQRALPHGWIERIDDDSGPSLKSPEDARVTSAFARFCRRHSIDELPQLWHVVRGEMSLIGPRPITAREIREHYGATAGELLRAKPGIAGLWQTSGRNRLPWDERRRLDLEFVRTRSLRMYLRIAARTIPEVWTGDNSW
jgi:lipopolysaccharide/colanic/teichoic acid biosynthesis glycosyltransferase